MVRKLLSTALLVIAVGGVGVVTAGTAAAEEKVPPAPGLGYCPVARVNSTGETVGIIWYAPGQTYAGFTCVDGEWRILRTATHDGPAVPTGGGVYAKP